MIRARLAAALVLAVAGPAAAQPMLYTQRLPEGTVYVRLVNALPGAASVKTDFAGAVDLGADGAARVSPYFVAGSAGGKTVPLQVTEGGSTAAASFAPKSGSFVTVVLHPDHGGVALALITDKPEYNQLRARLAFYNASDCTDASLMQMGGAAIFSAVPSDVGASRSVNPIAVRVTASCAGSKAPLLDVGQMEAGGLYTVWMMRLGGSLVSFLARDTIAPPRD